MEASLAGREGRGDGHRRLEPRLMTTRRIAKVLVANRGEIAVRVIRACRELGIAPVAVFSEADREALHGLMADEAYPIGPAPATESYLSIERLVNVAKAAGADAVHPGYGFLAENAAFAEACGAAGLVFVGPPPSAIRAMGDKIAARRIARELGVLMVPGTLEPVTDAAAARATASEIGYPLMIKAAMGGGGKGMRLVRQAAELEGALRAARGESAGAFGDSAVYLERYVEEARHIEIQVLADAHGRVIHLGERECRINAEDPFGGWLPSPGTITALRGASGPWVREDSGVYEGCTVPRFYDTLLAKLIVWGVDRATAIERMARALAEYRVVGVRTTIPVLAHIIAHADFRAGRLSTRLLERIMAGLAPARGRLRSVALVAAVLTEYERLGHPPLTPPPAADAWRWGRRPGWRSR